MSVNGCNAQLCVLFLTQRFTVSLSFLFIYDLFSFCQGCQNNSICTLGPQQRAIGPPAAYLLLQDLKENSSIFLT